MLCTGCVCHICANNVTTVGIMGQQDFPCFNCEDSRCYDMRNERIKSRKSCTEFKQAVRYDGDFNIVVNNEGLKDKP